MTASWSRRFRGSLAAMLTFLLGSLANVASAEALQWEQGVIELTAIPRQEKVAATFRFRNTGANPITIRSIKSSCDCTTAELGKKTYAPGEAGQVDVVFKLEGRTGAQEKFITITTDDEAALPSVLTLRVDIPLLVKIEPRLVAWRVGGDGGDGGEKHVEITAGAVSSIKIVDVQSEQPAFEVRVETVEANKHHRLIVKPRSIEETVYGRIVVTLDLGEGSMQTTAIYAYVR